MSTPTNAQHRAPVERDDRDYDALVLAQLMNHHQPDEAWQYCIEWEPLQQVTMLEKLKLPQKCKGRFSEAMGRLFGGQMKYNQLFRRRHPKLLNILREAAGETPKAGGAHDRISGMVGDKTIDGETAVIDAVLDRQSS